MSQRARLAWSVALALYLGLALAFCSVAQAPLDADPAPPASVGIA